MKIKGFKGKGCEFPRGFLLFSSYTKTENITICLTPVFQCVLVHNMSSPLFIPLRPGVNFLNLLNESPETLSKEMYNLAILERHIFFR